MLRLTRISTSQIPLEAPSIVPDRLTRLRVVEIERLPVQHGSRTEKLAEHFRVTGDAIDSHVLMDGDCSRVKWLGAGMTAGHLHIESSAGMHAGSRMASGTLEVAGSADDWLGVEMSGGLIHVHGAAGDHAGAAYEGSQRGMTGGVILVDGECGLGTGAVMRRGLSATAGCGDFAAASMIAGSLFVFGRLGRFAGAEMKRGTIAVFGSEPELLPTFRKACQFDPTFLRVFLRRLVELGFGPAHGIEVRDVQRFCGDLVSHGQGEILIQK
ncbi:MAG: formylmethanofuran dehydrogenase subunit C [Gemmataceae bacterium]